MSTKTKDSENNSDNNKPSYKESFRQWWNRSNLDQQEDAVLSMLPFYPESDGKRIANVINVPIDSQNYIHEFNIKNVEEDKKNKDSMTDHIVLIHGYGAALGLFFKNFEGLTEKPGVDLHALDLLGYGLSSRPKLPKFHGNTIEDVEKVEAFFIDAVENWRKAKNIERFHLIGHSFGGYLSSLYTLKYPDHVDKLVLVSPVGVERSIYDLSISKEEHDRIFAEEEQKMKVGPDVEQEFGGHNLNTDQEVPTQAAQQTTNPVKKSSSLHVPNEAGYVTKVPNLPRFMQMMWDNNMSPFTFIRGMGPIGPQMVSRWTSRRFAALGDDEILQKMHKYCYSTFVARASGEYALTRILGPGALARYPLFSRLPGKLKHDSLWLYGDIDWMSKEAGRGIVNTLKKSEPEYKTEFGILSNAGHHLYLDNHTDFNKRVYEFLGYV